MTVNNDKYIPTSVLYVKGYTYFHKLEYACLWRKKGEKYMLF